MVYEYKDLKGVVRVGDEVRAVPGQFNPCGSIRDDGSTTKKITNITGEQFYIDGCPHTFNEFGTLEIVGKEVTWETLRKGDIVLTPKNSRLLVLARLENVVFLGKDETDGYAKGPFSIAELQSEGATIVQPVTEPEVLELTVAEVEAKFGKKVKIVKSK